ncbi:MAG: class I SAM-dependent RNA methyltransferase [Rhodospirillum sp.]|jgi:23S rRNA (uracil1939-C5)-methyltransferase|nr:class I SAM-dependent RNA methyltransferase [Rhodospirillum sp.]
MSRERRTGSDVVELTTTAMGGQGDALAEWQGKRVFVPSALPGERVRARLQPAAGGDLAASDVEILEPSPDRRALETALCGGCALQVWAEPAYRDWKVDMVRQALGHRGLDLPERFESVFVPAATRRRADFAVVRQGSEVRLGFHARGSDVIVDQHVCPILVPALGDLMAPLRAVLRQVLRDGDAADILATETLTGFDLLFTCDATPNAGQRAALAGFAAQHDVARIGWLSRGTPEPIVLLRPPQVRFGDVLVDLPMPSFLQPSAEGEATLKAAVLAMVGKAKRIAELYAGAGTFTFDLAKIGKAHAVEGSKPSLAALVEAAKRAQLGHRITTEARDLEHDPLTFQELKNFDAVVFDPPRAGAKAQSEMLAKARVKRIVAVSCNPATFARDARTLVDGGYDLAAITVVDQFIWSPHVELVAEFRRR